MDTSNTRHPKRSVWELGGTLVAQTVKHLPTMQETRVQSLGREDPLEKEMATHSSISAWKIPWTEEPGRLQSMGSQRLRHDFSTTEINSLFFSTTEINSLSTRNVPDTERNHTFTHTCTHIHTHPTLWPWGRSWVH